MCGRFTYMFTWQQLHRLLNLTGSQLDLKPQYDVRPTHLAPVVREGESGRTLDMLKWGFRPGWSKGKLAPINARCETAETAPMFRAAFRARRCIIPVSGFYEWEKIGGKKQPWFFSRADGEPLLLAGLWEKNDEGENFTILTTASNEFMAPIHDRMPLIIEPEKVDRWFRDGGPDLLLPAAEGVLISQQGMLGPKGVEPTPAKPAPADSQPGLFG